jgi:hypothetical protein
MYGHVRQLELFNDRTETIVQFALHSLQLGLYLECRCQAVKMLLM